MEGDTTAAKILLEVAGLVGKGAGAGAQTNVLTQINISPQELADLERDLEV